MARVVRTNPLEVGTEGFDSSLLVFLESFAIGLKGAEVDIEVLNLCVDFLLT